MKRSPLHYVVVLVLVVLGVAAGILGEAEDAPGLVLFGLLLIASAALFWFKPQWLEPRRAVMILAGAVALTTIGAFFAGWLENSF